MTTLPRNPWCHVSCLKLASVVDDDQPSDQCIEGGHMLWLGYGGNSNMVSVHVTF